MKVFFSLVKIYFASAFNVKNFIAGLQRCKKKKDGTAVTRISAVKTAGVIVLFVLLAAEFLFVFGFFSLTLYRAAKDMHNIRFLFEFSAAILSVFSALFGFMLTASTYYIGEIEERLLSMPIKPKTLFGAKFAASCLNEIITSISFFAVLAVIYGIHEQPPAVFYVWTVLSALLIPLPIIACCYAVNVFIMCFFTFFKDKNVILTINALLGMAIALGVNYALQSMSAEQEFSNFAEKLVRQAALFERYGAYYPPVKLIGAALSNPASVYGFLSMAALMLFCLLLPAAALVFLALPYARSLVGFGEKKVKKLEAKRVSGFIVKEIKARPQLLSFVKREFDTMNRTPVYLLNGPFIAVFLPVLMIVIFAARGKLAGILLVAPFVKADFGFAILGLAAGVLGAMTNIADTSLSRDAQVLPLIKSLPVNIPVYMYAKLIHAAIFSMSAWVPLIFLPAFLFGLSSLTVFFACITALAVSSLLNLIGLFMDTANPKLRWDNPLAAMKQNMNVLFVTFLNFIVTAALACVLFIVRNAPVWLLLIYFVFIPGALTAVLIKPYSIFAQKKIENLEL